MDKQEIFDTVVKFLIKQGTRSYNDDMGCVYRGPGGLRCAVGCILPDEYYLPAMEGNSIGGMCGVHELPEFMINNLELLNELQKIHDNAYSPDFVSDIKDKFRILARKMNLCAAVLDNDRFDPSTWGL